MGGGSRADIQSLIVLRPLAFMLAAYALLVIQPGELRAVSRPLILLGLLAALALVQLFPMPPAVWTALPGRELFVAIAKDAGVPVGYRPMTLSPARTLNMLLSLCVPLAAILVFAIQNDAGRRRIAPVVLSAGLVSALVAVAQLAGVGGGSLYLYRVTNPDFPVGLFANRNHQALLMAITLVLLGELARRGSLARQQRPLVTAGLAVAALVVIALTLVSGSRAGLLLMVIALASAAVLVVRAAPRRNERDKRGKGRVWLLAAVGGGVLTIVAAMIVFSRAESIERLYANDALDDYRIQRLPILLDMMRDHWAAGIGFGTFEGVYRHYETVDALTPFIFNQAHNDWLQFPMEGGVPALVLLAAAIAMVAGRGAKVIAETLRGRSREDLAWLATLVLIAVASIVDYPLRTPIVMLIATFAFTALIRRQEPDAFE